MKRTRFTEEQIAFALRQVEGDVPVKEVCRPPTDATASA